MAGWDWKTHLTQAIGNQIKINNPASENLHMHAERYVSDVVFALPIHKFEEFKQCTTIRSIYY
ncbi:MAG: hypothetical protein IPH22_10755 [Nitrosomonas sp.]|nr:hypothetical protein [Nitrosomonas sp.]